MSSHKSYAASNTTYVPTPHWSPNNLTGTTLTSGLPAVPYQQSAANNETGYRGPYPGSVGLTSASPASSTGSPRSLESYATAYSMSVPSTPGAPYMHTVPLPLVSGSYGLPTPPNSPQTRPHPKLDQTLTYNTHSPYNFDVSYAPSGDLLALRQSALQPATARMVLTVPGIWTFEAANPRGVTVADVISAISQHLCARATGHEPEYHSRAGQPDVVRAYARRTAHARGDGLRRVDLLMSHTRFAGLSRARDGSDSWIVHFV
ncbi:hypothetical protein HETIRDRAFT_453867 [Heterobasidion irregulare TC 32-1]|uniref:DUF6699 domain-containing protein n=1 Tax=Heterobasidion irregulare (strain TC 32-1) TaxID=747525 RepID=W4JW00_HETIT|nr:uncharacterized protein HETIRDRAFT_453867 [Heterobasidion irregulare TC 32-1]ETW77727.1 hypothetical protein HETIRDRAFT_453867 [Heterobasidion irregulare TC 32-1]